MTPARPAARSAPLPSPSPALRLPRQTLAYLRAVAEGVPTTTAARTYLVDDGRSAESAHQAAVQAAVLIAQRARLGPRWRLLRSTGQAIPGAGGLPSPGSAATAAPSLEEWAEAEGLADWSIDELQVLYAERFPKQAGTGPSAARAARKAGQADRMRRDRLALLGELEAYAVDAPALSDPVAGWFDEDLASRLEAAGFHTLGELRAAVALGGRWWRGIRAFGPTKARDLAARLQVLVGVAPRWSAARVGPELAGRTGPNRGTAPQIDAPHDYAAINAWITARTHSAQTARAYRREAERFLLWLLAERGRAMSAANVDDCRAYVDFLARVPPEWISKRAVRRLAPGWAPFTAQPSVDSQRYALKVVNALFEWLVNKVGYLQVNPWGAINLRLPDDPTRRPSTSRAFSPAAWRALLAHLPALAPAAGARMRWLLVFGQATGLRAAELLRARRADLEEREDGYWLLVHGKGARNREVPVPEVAVEATRAYFQARGLEFDADLHPETPLLAILKEPELDAMVLPLETDAPFEKLSEDEQHQVRKERGYLAYPTLAAAFKRFVAAALTAAPLADLSVQQRSAAMRASAHWLRHTHATRAAEAAVPIDVLQANLGQADPRTTAGYYRAQEKRRRAAMERVFSGTE